MIPVALAGGAGVPGRSARDPSTEARPPASILANDCLGLSFDSKTGALRALHNKLTGETYRLDGEDFAVSAEGFRVEQSAAKLVSFLGQRGSVKARYRSGPMQVEVAYTLGPKDCFAEKQIALTCDRDYRLRRVVVSEACFSAPALEIVCYRYPKFQRPPGTEPVRTYFGRTPEGGFFTGVELPFDGSLLDGSRIRLGYAPSLKVKAGEKLPCEPVYFGVYRRQRDDLTGPSPPPVGSLATREGEIVPLRSESDAMVSMTSAILGPRRHGLVPMACGWHCEMQHFTYESDEDVEGDMKSLDFLAECGIDWLSDSHPWGGETQKMNALGENDGYEPGDRVRRFLEHARRLGVKVVMWPTMNNTHPWWGKGRPFRSDKPEWLLTPADPASKPDIIQRARGNCFANTPFFEWLSRVNLDGLATGYYDAWAMDGSFFGDGGWFTTIIPVDCASDDHDHLPGDSNYACQRALSRMIAQVRRRYPDIFIFVCRPPMDLGVWSLRDVDACFTLLERGTGGSNVAAGDVIRTWSRVRVHRDFFPHYVDQPLLFPSRANRSAPPNWPGKNLDYILLSALSCSPNQLIYLPTKTGIPEQDKAEIRRWLDWGRKNIEYLKLRRDLPDWPTPGKVDGSAHLVGDRGPVFLFNPNEQALPGEFSLTEGSIGLSREGLFEIRQEYPEADRAVRVRYGGVVPWKVPAESPVVLWIEKVADDPTMPGQ